MKQTRVFLLLGCLLLILSGSGLTGLTAYHYDTLYHDGTRLAQDGKMHLQHAEALLKNLFQGQFEVTYTVQAQQEFYLALYDFTQIKNDLAEIPEEVRLVPRYGKIVTAVQHVLPLAIELSKAGISGSHALTLLLTALHNPLQTSGQGITMEQFTVIKSDVGTVMKLLTQATAQEEALNVDDLRVDARLQAAVETFHQNLPQIQNAMQMLHAFMDVAPTVLGIQTPSSYLIEQLDSTELRPGGGFIGSYGVATIARGQVESVHMTDTYLLDASAKTPIPLPPAYQWFPLAANWSLRDSNLDADFPTAALYAEQLYHQEGGSQPLQGVIAITPTFVQNMLKITGPISVDEYHEVVSADTLIDRIHYHQLAGEWNSSVAPSPDGHSSLRKRFTELLFEHVVSHLRQIAPQAAKKLLSSMADALHTKDIQVYFNAEGAENVLKMHQLASTIQSLPGDGLFVVDANIISNKANKFMTYTLQDHVHLDTMGNAVHQALLMYNWPISQISLQNDYGNTKIYVDYVRIYTPLSSTLLSEEGWGSPTEDISFHRHVWGGTLRLPYGQTQTIRVTWKVPAAAFLEQDTWHYHYLLQRQAGIEWNMDVQIGLPSCAHMSSFSPTTQPANQSTLIRQYLTMDFSDDISYSCK